MMRARNVKAILLALAAWSMCAAPAVQAAMYKWTDESGTATFSDQPPVQPDKVRDLAVVEIVNPASPVPAREAQRVEPEKASTTHTQAKPEQPSQTRAPAKFGESFRPDPARAAENTAKQESDAVLRDLARLQARGRTEAVRDPCLISSDPRCYERNKDRYHPYFGYAPSVMQSASTSAAGATNAAPAGGAVGGQGLRDTRTAAPYIDPVTTGVR
jgi:hypothetical protein